MGTREIIDAKQNGNKVYVKGHAKATYMSDGSTVEESVNNKVTKVEGKQLSTEDFTTTLKNKLEGLSNYDDAEISQAVEQLRSDFDTLVSGDSTTAIKTFNEIIAFLDGIEDSESLDSIIASIEQQIAAKGTVTSITAGEGLTGGTITKEGTIALEEITTAREINLLGFGNYVYFIGNTPNDTSMTKNTSSKTIVKTLTIDKYGRLKSVATSMYTTYTVIFEVATTSKKGLMSASDKIKLNGIDMSTKQDTLVSGTNIKTINGENLLGSGDITISGGNGASGSAAYPYVEVSDVHTYTISPNTFYDFGKITELDVSLGDESEGVVNEFIFQFQSDESSILYLPDTVKFVSDFVIESGKTYQVSIVNNIGLIVSV